MVREKYGVRLTPEQRNQLEHLVRAGKSTARVTTRARILLKTDAGWAAPRVAEALEVAEGTVFRIKRRFAEAGLAGALQDRVQANRYRKLEDRGEAHPVSSTGQALVAITCSNAPEGHAHWTLQLLADQVVAMEFAGSISLETVRQILKKRTQTLEEERVVHPQGERGVRGADGGCAGPRIQYGAGSVPRSLRPRASRGVFRRDLQAAGRGGEATHQGQARTGGTL